MMPPASGYLGPGQYHTTESLIRKTVMCPVFPKADRFKDPTLRTGAMTPPRSPAAAKEESAVWKGKQNQDRVLWASQSEPRLVSRLRLGRADVGGVPPTFGYRESDVVVVQAETGRKSGGKTITGGVIIDDSVKGRDPPINGHPGLGTNMEKNQKPTPNVWGRKGAKLRLFGGNVPGMPRKKSSLSLMK